MYDFAMRSSRRTLGARGFVAATTAFLMCSVAACGGSSNDDAGSAGSNGGAGDEAAVEAAQERLQPYLESVEDIEVTTPLTRKPDEGLSVYYIRFNLPIAQVLDAPFAEATEALGWNGTMVPVDGTDPQSVSNAMIRAVSEGADYIAVNSASPQAMGPGLEAAKNAGVPVFLAAGIGDVEGEANGVYGNTQADSTVDGVLGLLDQMIVDSGGTGSALLVVAPDFPVQAPLEPAAKEHIAENCSECSLETVTISAADLGGDVASGTVAAIRQNPEIKYVIGGFDALVNGLPQALTAAGLNDVKTYIVTPSPPFVEQIERGDYAGGLLPSDQNRTWLLVDQIARQSVGMDTDQATHAAMYQQLWTTEEMPEGETTWDPPNFQERYKELWQVS